MTSFYQAQETELDQTMTLRREWEHATEQTRQLAVAADTELRRRHPAHHIEPLRSAEPGLTQAERDQLNLTPGAEQFQAPEWITTLAAERRTARQQISARASTHAPSLGAQQHVPTWPAPAGPIRNAILQPPRHQIPPALTASHIKAQTPQAEAQ